MLSFVAAGVLAAREVKLGQFTSSAAAHAKTEPQHGCHDRIECYMEAVNDKETPVLDHKGAHRKEGLSPMQAAWARDGAVWLQDFLPAGLADWYIDFWYKQSPGPGGWGYPTPYVEHKPIRQVAMYPPLMAALKELIGGEMVLHLTLTGFKSTTRSWHQDDFLNSPWRALARSRSLSGRTPVACAAPLLSPPAV
jgi:hypothetical protein